MTPETNNGAGSGGDAPNGRVCLSDAEISVLAECFWQAMRDHVRDPDFEVSAPLVHGSEIGNVLIDGRFNLIGVAREAWERFERRVPDRKEGV